MNQSLKEKFGFLLTAIFAFGFGYFSVSLAQTQIYRSMQLNNTGALTVGTSNAMGISGSTATFTSALPDTVGIGDALQYDSDNNGSIDKVVFIHGRTSSTVYTVKTSTGGTPTATSANDQDWSIFRAYTTLANTDAGTENTGINATVRAFDAGNRNIVTNDEVWNFALYRQHHYSATLTISGWVTDSTHYIRYYAPYSSSEVGTSQRHNGTQATSPPRFSNADLIFIGGAGTDEVICVRLEGLVHFMDAVSCENIHIADVASGSDIRIEDCVFIGRNGLNCSGTTAGIMVATDFFGKLKIKNCIFYDFDGSGNNSGAGSHAAVNFINASASNGSIYVYNCTDYGSNYFTKHEETQGSFTIKNSLSQNGDNTTAFFTTGGASFTAASDYNLSDKTNVPQDAPGANSKNSTTVTFINAAGKDFHLNSGDTGAGNSGTDLSTDTNFPVTTDIDRATRPTGANTVDIGADEGVLGAAEIDVKGNNVSIADGDATPSASDSTDFGSVITVGSTRSVTYTILNTGETSLTLSGTPKVAVSGTHAADFTVTTQPTSPVTGGGSTTFVVSFDPSATGTRSATLTITNSDANEGTYDFAIQGTGVTREIDLTGNGSNITNGAVTTSLENHTDFGRVAVQNATQSRVFTISNSGTSNLTLSGTPKVAVSGTNSADFTVTAQPSSPVAGSGSTTFTVVFDPSASGIRTATLSIANDDADENPFTFAISGLGSSGRQNSYGQFHYGQHVRY